MSLEKIVIDNIRRIRKEKGLSQEKLAEFCDTSASYIGLMETYKNIPKLSTIEKIAEALNINPITLFMEENETQNLINDETKERLKNQILQDLEKDIDKVFMQI